MNLKEVSPMATLLLFFLILFSLFSSSLASSTTYLNASETLLDSGYISMALTLQLVSNTLNLDSRITTIFAPSDPAFVHSGQPPFLLVQYHVLPESLPVETLNTLPFGTKIPTLSPNCSLIVTSSGGQVSINNVTIKKEAIYKDGSVIVYGIDEFFNSSFQTVPGSALALSPGSTTERNSSLDNEQPGFDFESFGLVSDLLRSKGCSIMAAFLDAQLAGPKDQREITIFAPVDVAFQEDVTNISEYALIFRQHVVPGLLSLQDLVVLHDGTVLPTSSKGFRINVTVSGDVPVLNGVPVVFLDMYRSDRLVVHGLNQLLTLPANQGSEGDSFSDEYGDQNPPDYGDYH